MRGAMRPARCLTWRATAKLRPDQSRNSPGRRQGESPRVCWRRGRQEAEQADHGQAGEQAARGGGQEAGVAQQSEVDHRGAGPALHGDERGDQDDGRREQQADRGAQPAVPAQGEGRDQGHEGQAEGERAERVRPAAARGARLGQRPGAECGHDEGGGAQHEVARPPARQRAREQGAHGDAAADEGAPHPGGVQPAARAGEGVHDQAEAAGQQGRAGRALGDAGQGELPGRGGERGEGGGEAEAEGAGQEDPAPAVVVGEAAGHQQEGGEAERGAVEQPGLGGERGVQGGRGVRQRDHRGGVRREGHGGGGAGQGEGGAGAYGGVPGVAPRTAASVAAESSRVMACPVLGPVLGIRFGH